MSIADGDSTVGTPLTLFLVQLMVVVGLSKILSAIFKYLKRMWLKYALAISHFLTRTNRYCRSRYWSFTWSICVWYVTIVNCCLFHTLTNANTGHIPKYTNTIFPKQSLVTFSVIANFGLIIFMFMVCDTPTRTPHPPHAHTHTTCALFRNIYLLQ